MISASQFRTAVGHGVVGERTVRLWLAVLKRDPAGRCRCGHVSAGFDGHVRGLHRRSFLDWRGALLDDHLRAVLRGHPLRA